jgi:hypothetical protein
LSGGAGCDEGGGGGGGGRETRKEGADNSKEEEDELIQLPAGPATDPLRLEELMKQAPAPPAQPG